MRLQLCRLENARQGREGLQSEWAEHSLLLSLCSCAIPSVLKSAELAANYNANAARPWKASSECSLCDELPWSTVQTICVRQRPLRPTCFLYSSVTFGALPKSLRDGHFPLYGRPSERRGKQGR